MKQWKRLAALSSAIVMAAATLTYFPNDTLQNIRLEISASAETTTEPQVWIEDNLTWTLTADGTLTISGEGAMKDYNSDDNPSPVYNNSDVKKIVIEDGVTSIGAYAFYDCSSLTSITIPSIVTSIGNSAFDGCRSLKSITIPDSVTSIGNSAFEACNSLSSITLSNNITSIGNWAFHGCSLTSITIPDSVTSIGAMAFHSCSNLKSITIPDSVTSIESAVFYNCTSLTSITIPNSVTSIGSYAFQDCSSLTSITLPDSVTSIGTMAFYNCTSLTSITIPDSVTSIGYNTFESCSSLTSITIPKSVTSIGSGVFDKCNNLTVYLESGSTLTSNALGVDESKIVSYWNEGNLTWKLDANGTLTISGTGAMKDYNDNDNRSPIYKNSSVKKIVVEKGVTSIGESAFENCSSLTSVMIPDSVISIGTSAFHSCSRLPSITIPDSVTSIGNFAFEACNSLSSITLSNNITSIGNWAFHGCSLTSITIPDSVTSIGAMAFHSCSNLKSITIPDSVTSIESAVFYNCTSLTSITIPDSVTSIGSYAFSECSSLTSITIPDSVTSIGYDALSDCSNLKTISLSCKSSLKKSNFGEQADLVSASHTLKKTEAKAATCSEDGNKEYWTCEYCGKYFLSDDANPETAKAVEQSECMIPAIQHKNATTRGASKPTETAPGYSGDRYCPDCDAVFEKGYTYWVEDNLTWKLYEDGTLTISGTWKMKNYNDTDKLSPVCRNSSVKKVVIEDGVTSIGDYAFYNCTSLTSITIPDSVTSIGYCAFNTCSKLTSITIPDSVTSIGNYAFKGCSNLSNITLSNNITSIGISVFEGCSNLSNITLSNNITSIGDFAFADCSSLTNITIPDSVISIGDFAFAWCSNLSSITLSNNITSIGNDAFADCSSLTSITIPESVTSIGNYAFSGCSSLTSITIPDNVTSIGECAFSYCTSLTNITIPNSVTSIGNKAFSDCTSLTNITIPDSVTSIGNKAFYNCTNLTTISLSCKSSLKKSDFGDQANLVSYASHTLKKIEAKAATCTENGNIEHWTCEHCGKYFLSDDSNPETAKAVELSEITIPNIKHSYDKNGFCKNDDTHYQPASYNEESEKYEISNAGQLYWFAEQVNSGNASLNAVLTTDIVVNETVLAADGSLGADPDTLRMWRSIGDDAENIFKGTFDGQGHTISGLYFSNDSNESDVMCASLFGLSAGIIQNVGLEDSYLNHYNISAGICASNNGQIVNCYNAGTILGYCASGICIENSDNGSIENCYNTGVIRGFGLVAGICNMNAGSMKDCYNNNDIIVMTDSTIIDENDEKSYASGICNINGSSGRIENCYHVGQVSGADVNNNICNLNAGQIENSYYDCNICDKDAITQNESSAVVKNVESKTTKQFASGEVTYLLNGDQSVRAFYQNLAKEKYPTLNQKSKVVMQLEMIYDESFGEDATTNKIYHIAGDTIALETSPDKAYTYQYFVNGKQIEKPNYTLTGNTKMTVKRVPVEIELSEIDTIQLTCQKKMTMDLTKYLKNFVDLKPVQFQLATGSKLPDGLKLTEDGMLSGTPKKAATVKTTIVLTAENDSTKEMNLVFIVNAPVTTTTTTITTTTTTKATTTTKPSKTTTTKVTTTTKPNKTTTTKATTTTTTTISSYGDVNLDGMVDILDAVFLNKYLATLIQFSDAQMANADCCQDGVLNDQDTTALMQFIILLIDDLPVQPTEK